MLQCKTPILWLTLLFPLVSSAVISEPHGCMYEWLRSIGLKPSPADEYRQLFLREEMSETVLQMTSLEQLKELGITKMGHRTLIHNRLKTEPMCEHNGACELSPEGTFTCSCPEGFSGESCENVTGCGETVCRNKGGCLLNSGMVQCTCASGFTGTFCENDICEHEPCVNGGICSRSEEGFKCTCPLGYEGLNCETMWLNRSSFIRLTKQVAFLERLHQMEAQQKEQELMHATPQGPRFFVKNSLIGPQGVIQTELFTDSYEKKTYMLFLSNVPSQPQLSGVSIYRRYDNGTLSLAHTLSLLAPSSLTTFTIGDSWYMAIVNSPSTTNKGPNTHTRLYKWSQGQLNLAQELTAPGARDVHYLIVDNVYHFLTVSCGSDGQGTVRNSLVYAWYNGGFVFYQTLATHGGKNVKSVETNDHRMFLTVSSDIRSTVFQWNGTYFTIYQELPASEAMEMIRIDSLTFLLAVGSDMSTLYRLDKHFVPHTNAPAATTAKYININSEYFIAFGHNTTVEIHMIDGAGLTHFQTLSSSAPVLSLSAMGGAEQLVISLTNRYDQPNTVLYQWSHP